MATQIDRDEAGEAAFDSLPTSNKPKRAAPKPEPSPQELKERKARRTVVDSYRVPPAFKDAVKQAALKYSVSKSELVQLFVLKGIQALEDGKVTLPVSSARNKLDLPPVPRVE